MARVVVDVMPKPEILDPQGKAVTGALARLGFAGMSVRQGKRFEIELDGELTEERLEASPEPSDEDDQPEQSEQDDEDEAAEEGALATQAG